MIAEEPVVLAFAGPRIEDSRSLGERGRKRGYGALDGGFEVEHVIAEKQRQEALEGRVSQDFLRASTMIVEPAWQAASRNANGRQAATRQK